MFSTYRMRYPQPQHIEYDILSVFLNFGIILASRTYKIKKVLILYKKRLYQRKLRQIKHYIYIIYTQIPNLAAVTFVSAEQRRVLNKSGFWACIQIILQTAKLNCQMPYIAAFVSNCDISIEIEKESKCMRVPHTISNIKQNHAKLFDLFFGLFTHHGNIEKKASRSQKNQNSNSRGRIKNSFIPTATITNHGK